MFKSTAARIMLYFALAWFSIADYGLLHHLFPHNPLWATLVPTVTWAIISPMALVAVVQVKDTKLKVFLEPLSMLVVVASFIGYWLGIESGWVGVVLGLVSVGGFLIALAEQRHKAKEAAENYQSSLENYRLLAFKRLIKERGEEPGHMDYELARLDTTLDSEPEVASFLAKKSS